MPGQTQLLATVVASENVKAVTYYVCQVQVTTGSESRKWEVRRRYSEFASLHKALTDLGFPCPALPPKQLWGGHTNTFIAQRQNALDFWIQGVMIIWQRGVSPERPGAAYAIGCLLEAFLCSPDSETFQRTLEEVQHEEKNSSSMTSTGGGGGGGLAYLEDADDMTPIGDSHGALTPTSPYLQKHVGPSKSSTAAIAGGDASSKDMEARTSFTEYQKKSLNRRKSKSKDALAGGAAMPSSFSDIHTLRKQGGSSNAGGGVASSLPMENLVRETVSKSVPPQNAMEGFVNDAAVVPSLPSMTPAASTMLLAGAGPTRTNNSPVKDVSSRARNDVQNNAPSAGSIGIAIDMRSISNPLDNSTTPSSGQARENYYVFDNTGNRVPQTFCPFTAKVHFGDGPEGRDEAMRSSGLLDACTPVSVPPTPQAQNMFNQQWNQYTSSVLQFVQERLNIVSNGRQNILDRHAAGMFISHDDDERDVANAAAMSMGMKGLRSANMSGPAPQNVRNMMSRRARGSGGGRRVNEKARESSESGDGKSGSNDLTVEDADAGAGGPTATAAQPDETRYYTYVDAGEHLVRTILKEAEADLLDWEFVSNTKDVTVMRRKHPIRKRSLLKLRDVTGIIPSPSPSEVRSVPGSAMSGGNGEGAAPSLSKLSLDPSAPMLRTPSNMSEISTQDASSAQHCFMGRGVIDASAEEIFELVRRPEKRHLYDSMLNEELMLENLAVSFSDGQDYEKSSMGNLLVFYHLFETNRCFLRYARDFCVVQYAKRVTVEKTSKGASPYRYVVVGASINHKNCPVRDDVERATLDLFGWVVEPVSASRSKVTYMIHIDFGRSGVPTHLLNTISFRQPLAIHYLRKYIQSMPPEQREFAMSRAAADAKKAVTEDANQRQAAAGTTTR